LPFQGGKTFMNKESSMPNKKITKKGIGCVIVMILFVVVIFPALPGAGMNTARATALKQRGRFVWLAISAANMERDLHGQFSLWPEDLEAKLGKPFDSAEAYFTYLMSNVESGKIEHDPIKRVVPDLKPEMLTGPGLRVATDSNLSSNANAWHVVCAGDESLAEMPLFISRNVKVSEIRYSTEAELAASRDWRNATNNVLSINKKIKPFGDTLAVWVSRGGNAMDARQKYLTRALVVPVAQPEGEPGLRVLPSTGGYR